MARVLLAAKEAMTGGGLKLRSRDLAKIAWIGYV